MAVSTAFLDAAANAVGALITHIGLVDDTGTELTGGTYARLAVTWTTASGNGKINLSSDKLLDVPAGATVGGWRGYSASTAGTNYGGADLTPEVYAGPGQYKLQAAATAYDLDAS